MTIKCPKCKEARPVSYFHANKDNKIGRSYWCKSCVNSAANERKHKDELFKRNSSACDSKLLDKRLNNELKEVWESE